MHILITEMGAPNCYLPLTLRTDIEILLSRNNGAIGETQPPSLALISMVHMLHVLLFYD